MRIERGRKVKGQAVVVEGWEGGLVLLLGCVDEKRTEGGPQSRPERARRAKSQESRETERL